MELAAQEEGMTRDLDDLHIGGVRRSARDIEPCARQQRLIFPVELVTMTVPFAHLGCLVRPGCDRILCQNARPRAEAHGAAHFLDTGKLAQFEDDTGGCGWVAFTRAGARQTADVAGKLDA